MPGFSTKADGYRLLIQVYNSALKAVIWLGIVKIQTDQMAQNRRNSTLIYCGVETEANIIRLLR